MKEKSRGMAFFVWSDWKCSNGDLSSQLTKQVRMLGIMEGKCHFLSPRRSLKIMRNMWSSMAFEAEYEFFHRKSPTRDESGSTNRASFTEQNGNVDAEWHSRKYEWATLWGKMGEFMVLCHPNHVMKSCFHVAFACAERTFLAVPRRASLPLTLCRSNSRKTFVVFRHGLVSLLGACKGQYLWDALCCVHVECFFLVWYIWVFMSIQDDEYQKSLS